ncbi:hypothetical protein BGZ83_003083 [Gryganskiella cystojenkinii]|nr:hypothetical protein BGZ83_003083 [Gryganskiella cystojenkinii]
MICSALGAAGTGDAAEVMGDSKDDEVGEEEENDDSDEMDGIDEEIDNVIGPEVFSGIAGGGIEGGGGGGGNCSLQILGQSGVDTVFFGEVTTGAAVVENEACFGLWVMARAAGDWAEADGEDWDLA